MILRRSYLKIILSLFIILWLGLLIFNYLAWSEAKHINATLQQLQTRDIVEADDLDINLPSIPYAYAYYLHQHGLFEAAIDAYGKAERMSPPEQRHLLHYNMGNLYLQEAAKLAERTSIDRASALADVAKDLYRTSLKQSPNFWPAKYNYEAAQRLSRDLPLGELQDSNDDTAASEELWSAMPGFPLGLP